MAHATIETTAKFETAVRFPLCVVHSTTIQKQLERSPTRIAQASSALQQLKKCERKIGRVGESTVDFTLEETPLHCSKSDLNITIFVFFSFVIIKQILNYFF